MYTHIHMQTHMLYTPTILMAVVTAMAMVTATATASWPQAHMQDKRFGNIRS